MNERLSKTEDKLNTIIDLIKEQGKTPTAHDWGYFNNYAKTLRLLKSESNEWGADHPDVVSAVNEECTKIEAGLDEIADRQQLFE